MRAFLVLLLAAVTLSGCNAVEAPDDTIDTDKDGLTDSHERKEKEIVVKRAEGPVTLRVRSDPDHTDADLDGLDDLNEGARGTDPNDPDTDRDGLLDGPNRTLDAGSPLGVDWRARGIREAAAWTFVGELSLCPDYAGTRPNAFSSDLPIPDTLGDGEELAGWTIVVRGVEGRVRSSECAGDTDLDGAADHLEREWGSDPTLNDTDGDGEPDAHDADPLWDIGVRIEDVELDGPERVSLQLALGEVAAATYPGAATLDVDASDSAPTPGDHVLNALVTAVDPDTGAPVEVFPGGSQVILALRLVGDAVDGEAEPGRLSYRGSDGGISFVWSVTKR